MDKVRITCIRDYDHKCAIHHKYTTLSHKYKEGEIYFASPFKVIGECSYYLIYVKGSSPRTVLCDDFMTDIELRQHNINLIINE